MIDVAGVAGASAGIPNRSNERANQGGGSKPGRPTPRVDEASERAAKGGGSKPGKSTPRVDEKVEQPKAGAHELEKATKRTRSIGETAGGAIGDAVEKAAKSGAEIVAGVGKKTLDAARPIVEPTIREAKEAGEEVSEAGVEYGKGWWDSLNPLDDVGEIWSDKDQSVGGKSGAVIGKVVENLVTEGATNVKNLFNLQRETLEGAAEIALNNPGVNAAKEAGKGARHLGSIAAGWIGDRVAGGADGAAEASKTGAKTGESIASRTIDQAKEDAREIGDAAKDLGSGWFDSLNPLDDVSDAWNSGDSVGEKVGGAAGKIIENGVSGASTNATNAGKVVVEIGEAAIENAVTTGENVVDAVTGGAQAVGGFFGGLFS